MIFTANPSRAIAAAVSAVVSFAICAADTNVRHYALPEHGFLELEVPRGWNEIVRRSVDTMAPTIVFGPVEGLPFEISVSPSSNKRTEGGKRSTRERVEQYLEGIKPRAVETDIELDTIESPNGRGDYFSATDKSPQPGDYKFLTHGEFDTDGLAITFTILSLDGQQQIVRDALAMVRAARRAPK